MELSKAKEYVLSAKKAIFCPESGAPLSGRYCWREGDLVVYLDYDGRQDHLRSFHLSLVSEFETLNFLTLMQKHIISHRKLPEGLVNRVRGLIKDQAENLHILKEKKHIFPLGSEDYLLYHPLMGYGHIKNNQGWHIRPDYGKYFQRMLLNLWQEPGIRTVAPPRTLAFFMKDYFERLNEYLDLIQYREYGLFKGEQGILFYQGSYFCLRLNSDYQISPVSWQEPARCLVSQAFLIEHLMEGYYQRQGKQYPYFSLKRIPGVLSKSIALFAERIFQ